MKIEYQKGDIIGKCKYIKDIEVEDKRNRVALFECKCGNEFQSTITAVKREATVSCGCRFVIHGATRTLEYNSWRAMIARCTNPDNDNYMFYGGRGIKVCERWSNPETGVINFIADMGKRPGKGYSLDRIDPNGNYCPENCRWASKLEQANNVRNNLVVEYKGERKTVAELAREYNLNYFSFRMRIKSGWDVERAITEPFTIGKNQFSKNKTN